MSRDFARVTGRLTDPELGATLRRRVIGLCAEISQRILDDAKAQWPVRSGRSLASLFIRDESEGDRVDFRIGADAEYARFIRSTKIGKERDASRYRHVMTEHLQKPVRAARKEVVARGAQAAVEVLGG